MFRRQPKGQPTGGRFAPFERSDDGVIFDIGPNRTSFDILRGAFGDSGELDPITVPAAKLEQAIVDSIAHDRFVRRVADDVHDKAVERQMATDAVAKLARDANGNIHFDRRYDLDRLVTTTMLDVRAKQYGVESVLHS